MPGNYINNPWIPNYAQGTVTSPINPSYSPTAFPAPYTGQNQNTFAPMPPQQSYDQSSDISGVVWALGDAGATSYPVARGTKLLIMDTTPNSPYFWIKETDQYTGRPLPMRKFRYEDVTEIQNGGDDESFASHRSYARMRNPMTGRYMDRDMGYNGHSVHDRMVAALEGLYDQAKTDYDRETIDNGIRMIRQYER